MTCAAGRSGCETPLFRILTECASIFFHDPEREISAVTRHTIKRVPIGTGTAGIPMEPGGGRAFVSCSPDDYVGVIDLKTLTVAGKIDAGHETEGLAWAAGN
jgi:DNA-binding beta-propeller fold protein YncE